MLFWASCFRVQISRTEQNAALLKLYSRKYMILHERASKFDGASFLYMFLERM